MTLLLGNESFSGSNTESTNADWLRWYVFTAVESGNADTIRVSFDTVSPGTGIKFAVYTNDASLSLLGQTAPSTTTADAEQDFALEAAFSVVQGESYRLALLSSGGQVFKASADTINRAEPATDLWDYSDPFPEDLTGESGGGSLRKTPAIRVLQLQAPAPSITLPTDLQPGASFTLNYSNYDAVPVSPVTITDSNNNSITVPVTINDNGDGTGTATGTMPSLPSSGTSQGLLFGNVTVELGT